jgi:LmbE family N-acetylglucosaminyl deacetylase
MTANRSVLDELWQALLPLRSVAGVMMTGAHPDDEASALLAQLAKGDGARVTYACATRGEGGQNALGPESGEALAAIRTREMEEAARVLGMELHWLDLPDFGFAKSAEATLAIWSEERLLERLVRTIRMTRPDVLCPTFLDVPGQHGHHRAVTRATIRAFDLAADPAAFPEQIEAGLASWSVAKLYLPAFSGAGATYDDAAPPPNATLSVEIDAFHTEIGRRSRACHRSQGMDQQQGDPAGAVPVHLLKSRVLPRDPEVSIFDGLPVRLSDLGDDPSLRRADEAIAAAFAAFPQRDRVAASVHAAIRAVDDALPRIGEVHRHRLENKRRHLSRASVRALTSAARLELPETLVLRAPAEARVTIAADGIVPDVALNTSASEVPVAGGRARFTASAQLPSARLRYRIDDLEVSHDFEAEPPPLLVPVLQIDPVPESVAIRAGAATDLQLSIGIRNNGGKPVDTQLDIDGISALPVALAAGARTTLDATVPVPPIGRHRLALGAERISHGRVRALHYPHIGRSGWIEPATVDVLVLDAVLPPDLRLGYVDGGGDRIAGRLEQLGIAVIRLAAEALADDLGRFDTIMIGVKAFGRRPDLLAARARLHDFVRRGGHLVTQLHRPEDGWDPAATPPARLEIGRPSLRWRVCDPAAPVTVLAPDHPLLTWPNRIGPEDWSGWVKERGLYFASAWDDAYEPLLAMADAGEAPLRGGLISARLGKGRHTHVALALAHQAERLVPGALRLLVNLAQAAA